jgi:putative chitinase
MRPIDVAKKLCPNAKPVYLQAIEAGDARFQKADITTPRRLAHFLAQAFHESDGLTVTVENGRYSEQNLADMWDRKVWRRYFASRGAMIAMAAQCRIDGGERLFSIVYGGRMGNGGPETGDGWRYRGRGLLQTTGKDAYRRYGALCGADFVADPDLLLDPRYALVPALAEWAEGGCNAMADQDDIVAITKRINGGTIGLASRRAWLAKVRPVVGDRVDFKPATAAVQIAAPVAAAAVAATTAPGHTNLIMAVGLVLAVVVIGALIWRHRKGA